VVTAPEEPLLDEVVGVVVVVAGVVVVEVVVVGVEVVVVGVVAVAVVVLAAGALATVERRASAGSWPDTSATAISTHAARNTVTVPAAIRRRIDRTRARRRARMVSASVEFMGGSLAAAVSNYVRVS
jgi:hypothetical protein